MAMFGKKDKGESSKSEVPVQAVLSMQERGLTNEQVIEQLKGQGYSLQSIRDALSQASVKSGAVAPEQAPKPVEPSGPALPPLPGAPAEPAPAAPAPPIPAPAASSPARGAPNLNVVPSFKAPTAPKPSMNVEEIERVLEEIVDERWKDVNNKFSKFESERVRNDTRLNELAKQVNSLASRVDELSSVVMSKVDEYQQSMEDVEVEIKALEKVMQKLVPSLSEQVRELKDVVGGFKGQALK